MIKEKLRKTLDTIVQSKITQTTTNIGKGIITSLKKKYLGKSKNDYIDPSKQRPILDFFKSDEDKISETICNLFLNYKSLRAMRKNVLKSLSPVYIEYLVRLTTNYYETREVTPSIKQAGKEMLDDTVYDFKYTYYVFDDLTMITLATYYRYFEKQRFKRTNLSTINDYLKIIRRINEKNKNNK